MKKYIIYHDRCPDGLTAAALFKIHTLKYNYEDFHNFEFIPGNYNMSLKDLDIKPNSIVYFLDFSFKLDMFLKILEDAHTVFLLDHHKTAYEELNHLFSHNKLKVYFDMNECGSSLTYKYLYPQQPLHILIEHIKDQDLWLWRDPNSRDYCSFLSSKELTLDAYFDYYKYALSTPYFQNFYESKLMLGKVLRETNEKDALSAIETNLVRTIIDSTEVCVINCSSKLTGFVKKELIEERGENVLITYSLGSKGMRISIRVADDMDAIAIAKLIDPVKAGGHPLAAGAFIPYEDFSTHWFTKLIFSL